MVAGGWQFALLMLSVIMASMVAVAMGLRTPAGSARPIDWPDLTIGRALQQAVSSRDYILLTVGFFVCGLQLVLSQRTCQPISVMPGYRQIFPVGHSH